MEATMSHLQAGNHLRLHVWLFVLVYLVSPLFVGPWHGVRRTLGSATVYAAISEGVVAGAFCAALPQ